MSLSWVTLPLEYLEYLGKGGWVGVPGALVKCQGCRNWLSNQCISLYNRCLFQHKILSLSLLLFKIYSALNIWLKTIQITCRIESASQLLLMATTGKLGSSLCPLHLWRRSRLVCFFLLVAGWAGTRSKMHSPDLDGRCLCAAVFIAIILFAGRSLDSAWSPPVSGRSLPPESASVVQMDIPTCEHFLAPMAFPH